MQNFISCYLIATSITSILIINVIMMDNKQQIVGSSSCNVCGHKFVSNTRLMSHMQIHRTEPYKTCNICNESFDQEVSWRLHEEKHLQSEHHIKSNLIDCYICQKSFSNNNNLKLHMYTHKVAKPYKCGKCEKGFKSGIYLTMHEKSNICHKAVSIKGNLKIDEITNQEVNSNDVTKSDDNSSLLDLLDSDIVGGRDISLLPSQIIPQPRVKININIKTPAPLPEKEEFMEITQTMESSEYDEEAVLVPERSQEDLDLAKPRMKGIKFVSQTLKKHDNGESAMCSIM